MYAGIQLFHTGRTEERTGLDFQTAESAVRRQADRDPDGFSRSVGGARVQYDLRKSLVFLDALTINKPEIFVANCASKFDDKNR
jgi:hypothetical protein